MYKIILISLVLLLCSAKLSSNENRKLEIKPLGVGIHLQQLMLSELSSNFMVPANKIIVAFSNNSFRFEPSIGAYNYTIGAEKNKIELKGINVCLGLLGMLQIDNININMYYGIRVGFSYLTFHHERIIDGFNKVHIGPALGAEYFITDHFSIGGELGFKCFYDNYRDTGKQYFMQTITGLLLKYYF